MTESELLIVLNRFLDSNVKLSLLTYVGAAVVSIIVGVFSASLTAYFKKSAEVSALSDRIDETCKQLEQQAKVVKRVEADISNQTWIEQQRWLFRKDLYLAIIDLLIRAREQSLALDEMINSMPGFYFDEESELDEDQQIENWENLVSIATQECHDFVEENITPVAEEIALLVNRQGRLFLSKNALLILADFYNSGETWYKKELEEERFDVNNLHSPYGLPSGPTEHGYLCHYSKAAKEAYRMIIREAKSDLKIDITLVNSKS
ncbi:hypothetical protein [Vibrio cholerae]|uniref:hypothetical protein n=1 Tax=Vibrio cholerae TaxID=666 RepID=UPI00015642AC|nr:hypothetical protein [Vibrio cholerae]KNA44220.1 hypothetical protein A5A_023887 [Vibrio cholerae MZO-2]MCD6670772.1 hypothetical protein [Vibrio cholerae]OEC24356.1 hypothetical protein BFX12_17575 [Vibrio cholerae]TQO61618.1 hypothetical protein FLM08_15990 [Vibrio cholerae]